MIAANREALVIQMLDIPDYPVAADPDRVETACCAWRVPPAPGAVGDRQWTVRAGLSERHVSLRPVAEVPTQSILESVYFGGPPEAIVYALSHLRAL